MPEKKDRPGLPLPPEEEDIFSASLSDTLSSDTFSSDDITNNEEEEELIQFLPPKDDDQTVSKLITPMCFLDKELEPIGEKSRQSEEQINKEGIIDEKPYDDDNNKPKISSEKVVDDKSLTNIQNDGKKDRGIEKKEAILTENKDSEKQDDKNVIDDSFKNLDSYEDQIEENVLRTESFCRKERKHLAKMAQKKSEASRTEKRTSQWEELMRKFSEAHKEECKTVSLDIPRAQRSIKQFPTGSTYEGTWDLLGMSGYGTYTFPNGVIYMGDFDDGMFHGEGELRYPDGAILRGTWRKGHMIDKTLLFADGLEYCDEDWEYCKLPDRRFALEYDNGLQPGGKSYLTADQPTKEIPRGYYDTGDGFYDPKTKIVYSADNITDIVRSAGPLEAKWIVENCRTSPDEAVGPRPDLYEEWSEPQTNPEPPPQPPVATRASTRRVTEFSEDFVRHPAESSEDTNSSCSSSSFEYNEEV